MTTLNTIYSAKYHMYDWIVDIMTCTSLFYVSGWSDLS